MPAKWELTHFSKRHPPKTGVSSSFSSRSDLLTLRYFYVATPGDSSTQKDAVNVIGIPVTFFLSALLEKERVIVLYLLFNAPDIGGSVLSENAPKGLFCLWKVSSSRLKDIGGMGSMYFSKTTMSTMSLDNLPVPSQNMGW